MENKVILGKSGEEEIVIYTKMANRHGMIAGATGTGKTVTLKTMAEGFSKLGVPVFMADVKGDLASICKENKFPVNFWDVYGEKGMPLRTTISEMGPLLLSRVLGLNDTQSDILTIIFKIADEENLLLIDTKDLKAMIGHVSEKAKDYSAMYGNIAQASLNAITRGIVTLESEGGDKFFGEPALSITDWLCTDCSGKGMIQILDCQKLNLNPKMYSTFLLWMISELYETLPEVGDADKPKMVFFFDEAHMLFDEASKDLLNKIEQVVKLIRSKGVGIYFVTQNPSDIPDGVLAQLGNKVQHALHAYTPKEQKGLKSAADSFRANPEFDTIDELQKLGVGEALVSILDESGVPTIVKKTKINLPESILGALEDSERQKVINNSLLLAKYSNAVDRDSAYEFLVRKGAQTEELPKEETETAKAAATEVKKEEEKLTETEKLKKKLEESKKKEINKALKSTAKTTAGTIGRELGKQVGNSVGGSFGKTLGGNVGASLARGIIGTLFSGK